jgi:UDP-N-acetylglucosamine 2-epimerase (non-hydrolysing)
MIRVLTIFGTRPEAIKMAPLIQKLAAHPDQIAVVNCVTAQHRQMLDQVLNLFEITPDIDLDIMRTGQDLFDLTANIILRMRDVFNEVKPDICLVHGDTTTSVAASLAAFYSRVAVGHVEAGLRTHLRYSPFPEELNRQITGRLASHHFAPTVQARDNLLGEGIAAESITVTGNTVIDALMSVAQRIDRDNYLRTSLAAKLEAAGYAVGHRPYILVTGHRRENFGAGIENICHALRELALARPDHDFVYPMHLNPNVRAPVRNILSSLPNVYLIEPLDYAEFIFLMKSAYLILTDSGGIQEEGPSLGKPILVTRETTERPEAVAAGTALVVGTSTERIVEAVNALIDDRSRYDAMANAANPYGDGRASDRIVDVILRLQNGG